MYYKKIIGSHLSGGSLYRKKLKPLGYDLSQQISKYRASDHWASQNILQNNWYQIEFL